METIELFFELIKYAIRGENLSGKAKESVSEQQLNELLCLSKMHDVVPMVSYSLIENGMIDKSSDYYKKFFDEQNFALFRYENIKYELGNICELFEKHGVKNIPLKGSVIRLLYPQPWMRTSCDIDILINKEDSKKATQILVAEYGCKFNREWEYEIAFDTPGKVHIELHTTLESSKVDERANKILKTVWDKAESKEGWLYSKQMPDEMYYFYHVTHMAKHFSSSGCGVRPFIDLWILNNKKEYDQEKRNALLEGGGLAKFNEHAINLAKAWVEGAPCDQTCFQMQEYILNSGVYGNSDNTLVARQTEEGGKFRYVWRRIFLSYNQLKKQYPVLEKRKWLTPFYEIRRWCRLIFLGGATRSMKKLNHISAEQVKNRESMMKNLGLWQ